MIPEPTNETTAKTSRIESAKQAPSEADITAWCRACGAPREIPDLIAASRAADSMYVEYRRVNRAGMRRMQESRRPLYERTRLFKAYCPSVIPGWLQTPEYAAALLTAITGFRGTPDDVAGAVAARMNRNKILGSGSHRFALLAEEAVLRYRIGGAGVMAAQLARLAEAAALPGVALGVIPLSAPERPAWPLEQFTVFDDERVHIELLSAQVTVTAPSEITLYVRAFERLAALAVYGPSLPEGLLRRRGWPRKPWPAMPIGEIPATTSTRTTRVMTPGPGRALLELADYLVGPAEDHVPVCGTGREVSETSTKVDPPMPGGCRVHLLEAAGKPPSLPTPGQSPRVRAGPRRTPRPPSPSGLR